MIQTANATLVFLSRIRKVFLKLRKGLVNWDFSSFAFGINLSRMWKPFTSLELRGTDENVKIRVRAKNFNEYVT